MNDQWITLETKYWKGKGTVEKGYKSGYGDLGKRTGNESSGGKEKRKERIKKTRRR